MNVPDGFPDFQMGTIGIPNGAHLDLLNLLYLLHQVSNN